MILCPLATTNRSWPLPEQPTGHFTIQPGVTLQSCTRFICQKLFITPDMLPRLRGHSVRHRDCRGRRHDHQQPRTSFSPSNAARTSIRNRGTSCWPVPPAIGGLTMTAAWWMKRGGRRATRRPGSHAPQRLRRNWPLRLRDCAHEGRAGRHPGQADPMGQQVPHAD